MGKLTIQEIAKILVEKNKLSAKEANQFAALMFEVIQQGLDNEGQVKIKGLGTFKMIRVEARESISVRTGERVMIDSHTKITFTPDATMKELVNKPFSQFETVILNDGVEFEDLADDLTDEEMAEAEAMEEEQPVVMPLMDIVDEPADEVKEAPAEEPVTESADEPAEEPTKEQKEDPIEESAEDELEEEDEEEEEESGSWKKTIGYGLLTLALMAASAYGGYWYGQRTAQPLADVPAENTPEVVVVDSVEVVTADTVAVSEAPSVEQPQAEPKPVAPPQPEVKKEKEEEPFWKKYEAMDARVRTGAYHIIGTDHEVTVRKGETLSRITRRELGDGMSCYIEVYNGLSSNSVLKEGQIIKIPKLKWKKKRRSSED